MALIKLNNRSSEDNAIHGRRNLIINGAMQVAQRGNSTGITDQGYYGPDRWNFAESGRDQFEVSISQTSDGPDGYANSWKMETTTVETAVDSSEYVMCLQRMEAQALQHLKYGTSDAQQLTASFWVKSSVASTFAVTMYAGDGARVIGSTYTINSASTWEYKTITFDGDVGGTINDDNGDGLYLAFVLAAGSGMRDTDNTSWSAYASGKLAYGHTAAANAVITTSNATWQITGVQLEVGEIATPFEHRSYGEELSLCMRYFQWNPCGPVSFSGGSNQAAGSVALPVALRATPSITVVDGTSAIDELYVTRRDLTGGLTIYDDSPSIVPKTSYSLFGSCSAGATANTAAIFMSGHWSLDSEL